MRFTIPNQLTLLRIFLTPVFVFYYLRGDSTGQLISTIVFIIASITDWYDGWYARRFGVITRWGQFMDPLADKILVSSALIVFAALSQIKWWMVWVIVGRDIFVTTVRIYALQIGSPIVTHSVAKWKTFFQMITIFYILALINILNYTGGTFPTPAGYFDYVGIPMLIVTLLTLISAGYYIVENGRLVLGFLKFILIYPFRWKK